MARAAREKRRKRDKPRRRGRGANQTAESPLADFLTVGWLMSALTLLVGDAMILITASLQMGGLGGRHVDFFRGLLTFATFITAAVSLILLLGVLRLRRSPLPRVLTTGGAVVAALSLAVGLLRML